MRRYATKAQVLTKAPPDATSFEIPIRTYSILNLREHWARRHRRSAAQRRAVELFWPWRGRKWLFPVEVTLTRIGLRKLDSDNLQGALKAVRDQVAKQLGVDDGYADPVRWLYASERGPWGVRIEVLEGPFT